MEESKICCEVFDQIKYTFSWFAYEDEPLMLTAPHLVGLDKKRYFVNHCPSCGKDIRNMNILKSRVDKDLSPLDILE